MYTINTQLLIYLYIFPFTEIPDGTKKCCSACLTRLSRKITQVTGSTENPKSRSEERLESVLLWSDEEIETLKMCLRNSGKNWSVLSENLNKSKSPEQCKKFFYNTRKKHQLDKLVLEYKRANQNCENQPPSLSTDEESGSSTSSCDEDGGLPQNSNVSSGRNSPARNSRGNSASANGEKWHSFFRIFLRIIHILLLYHSSNIHISYHFVFSQIQNLPSKWKTMDQVHLLQQLATWKEVVTHQQRVK